MRTTGMISRIDNLGRIVIPKEIRRDYNIREGDALELYTDCIDGKSVICFAKYNVNHTEEFNSIAKKVQEEINENGSKEMSVEFLQVIEHANKILDKIFKIGDWQNPQSMI